MAGVSKDSAGPVFGARVYSVGGNTMPDLTSMGRAFIGALSKGVNQ